MAFEINNGTTGFVTAITTDHTAKTTWQQTPHYAGIKRDDDNAITGMFSDGRDITYQLANSNGVGIDWCTIGFGTVDPTNTAKLILYKVTENTSSDSRSVLVKLMLDDKITSIFMPITQMGVPSNWTITASLARDVIESEQNTNISSEIGYYFIVKKNEVETTPPSLPTFSITYSDGTSCNAKISATLNSTGKYVVNVINMTINKVYKITGTLATSIGGKSASIIISTQYANNIYARLYIGKGVYYASGEILSSSSSIELQANGTVSVRTSTEQAMTIQCIGLSKLLDDRSVQVQSDLVSEPWSGMYSDAHASGSTDIIQFNPSGFTIYGGIGFGGPIGGGILSIPLSACKTVINSTSGFKKYYINIWIKPTNNTGQIGFTLDYTTPS